VSGAAPDLKPYPYPSPDGAEAAFSFWTQLRRDAPVWQLPDRPQCFIVTRFEDVRYCMTRPDEFSSAGARSALATLRSSTDPGPHERLDPEALACPHPRLGVPMNESDGERHRTRRSFAREDLAPTHVTRHAAAIEAIVEELIDGFVDSGHIEFMEEFAFQLPIRAVTAIMDLPHMDRLRDLSRSESVGISWMPMEAQLDQQRRKDRLNQYVDELLLSRHQSPGDDMLSRVIQAQIAHDGHFDLDELRPQVKLLITGGINTSAHFLGNGMRLLLANPAVMARVTKDPSLIPQMIEEVFRLDSPVPWTVRQATHETEVAGTTIPAGSFMLLMTGSANRDELRFADAETLDLERETRAHLGLGHGRHFCLGAPLARLQLRIAFEQLLGRLADIRYATPGEPLKYARSASYRALLRLDLEFTPAAHGVSN
jgi:cytochrome P450